MTVDRPTVPEQFAVLAAYSSMRSDQLMANGFLFGPVYAGGVGDVLAWLAGAPASAELLALLDLFDSPCPEGHPA